MVDFNVLEGFSVFFGFSEEIETPSIKGVKVIPEIICEKNLENVEKHANLLPD